MTKLKKGLEVVATNDIDSWSLFKRNAMRVVLKKGYRAVVVYVEPSHWSPPGRLVGISSKVSGMLYIALYDDLAANCVPVKTKRRAKRHA